MIVVCGHCGGHKFFIFYGKDGYWAECDDCGEEIHFVGKYKYKNDEE